jgi:hypothetical protein
VIVETLNNPGPLFNQDLVITHAGSNAVLILRTQGTTIRLNENSRFVAELDATREGGVLGTILDGTVTILNPGKAGSFRLFREGREISLNDTEKLVVPVLSDSPTTAPPAPEATPSLVITATLPDEAATPVPRPAAQTAPATGETSDLLTNDDILRQLRSQTSFFQRCYLNFIHRERAKSGAGTPAPTGIVTVSFDVQPTGKVNDASLVRSDFSDSVLNNCVLEVIGRTQFKTFKGEAVPVQQFPISLQ